LLTTFVFIRTIQRDNIVMYNGLLENTLFSSGFNQGWIFSWDLRKIP